MGRWRRRYLSCVGSGVFRVLEPAAQAQLSGARDLLATLRETLAEFGAGADDRAALAASIHQLDELFLIVIVGEFNAGKSAFINGLLGRSVMKEGVTPTTAQIQLLKYGDVVTSTTDANGLRVLTAPVELLRDIHIVDTPGTNAIVREHERITTDFVPRSDLVLFVTSADRPFTETERVFLEAIRDWGKKIVIVLNKIDIFSDAAQLHEVVAFVHKAAADLLGVDADVLPVSARLALRAKQGEPSVWAASGFEALEHYLQDTLDARNRFRLKLANPLGVGLALANRFTSIAGERLMVMHDDLQLLGDIDRQITMYRADMARGLELRITAVEKVLADMEARGDRFFEETLRLGRFADLLNRARVQKEFEDKVVADAPAQIERRVTELIDWLVDQDFRQWEAVTRKLSERHREHASRVLGSPEVGSFHNDRSRLMDSVGREAQRVVETYDKRREGEAIADQARIAVAGGSGGWWCRARPRHACHNRRVHRGCRYHRHPARQRRARSWISDHPGATAAGEGDAPGKNCRAPDSTLDGPQNRIRGGAGAQRTSTYGRDCALRTFCTGRRAALEAGTAHTCRDAGPDDHFSLSAVAAGGRSLAAANSYTPGACMVA